MLEFLLENEDFKVVSCATSVKGLCLAKQQSLPVIVLDHLLAHISEIEICRKIRTYDKRNPVIFFFASIFAEEREAGIATGASDDLMKPQDFEWITKTIKPLVS